MLKILIAHDGSDCSDKALRDLRKAGMPEKAEVVVLTVADTWRDYLDTLNLSEEQYRFREDETFNSTELSSKEAKDIAQKAAQTLKSYFPCWKIDPKFVADLSAEGIIDKINEWKPDFVAMGSHGRSSIGRLLFGSVSQKVLTHVHCNLRISRGLDEEEKEIPPQRIVVAYDGSQESETAFEAALCRNWPRGTAIKLITTIDTKVSLAFLHPTGPIRYWTTSEDKDPLAWVDRMLSYQKERIREKGWVAYSKALRGEPKRTLLKEAEDWGADTIFVGPRGLTGRERIIVGSVSTALATHAHCSVEVVHRLWDATVCCGETDAQHRDCMLKKQPDF